MELKSTKFIPRNLFLFRKNSKNDAPNENISNNKRIKNSSIYQWIFFNGKLKVINFDINFFLDK